MFRPLVRSILTTFFFGNYFYGVCAALLSVEAALQQGMPLNDAVYYIILFLCTVLFYTHAYRAPAGRADVRSVWYHEHHVAIRATQTLWGVAVVVLLGWVLAHASIPFASFTWQYLVLLLVFPCAALAYYGAMGVGIRRYGLLKPIVIGFVWAGVVTVYPVLFRSVGAGDAYPFSLLGVLLFLKNLMYIAVLGVLFDIKDHAADHRDDVRTLVVRYGLRATLFRFVAPLTALGLGCFLLYGSSHGFSIARLVLNALPFVLLFVVALAFRRRRSMLYYYIVADGLLLVKATCGIVAMKWF